jgi:hypothetical protein
VTIVAGAERVGIGEAADRGIITEVELRLAVEGGGVAIFPRSAKAIIGRFS